MWWVVKALVFGLSNAICWYILVSKSQNDPLSSLVVVKNLQLSYSAIINLWWHYSSIVKIKYSFLFLLSLSLWLTSPSVLYSFLSLLHLLYFLYVSPSSMYVGLVGLLPWVMGLLVDVVVWLSARSAWWVCCHE